MTELYEPVRARQAVMASPTPELIGIVVSGVVAGLVLIIVFVIVAVYCYRAIDSSGNKKVIKAKRKLYYAENGAYLQEPIYYGESVSSVGTTAHLVPPSYSLPVMYGNPVPGDGHPGAAASTLEKAKRKKAFVSHLQTMDRSSKYSEREKRMEFGEERRDSRAGSVRGENPVTTATPTTQPDEDEPVIVTYLEEVTSRQEVTEVKSVETKNTSTDDLPAPPTQPTADPDNGERTPSPVSGEEGSAMYHHRQREPPKGDINPPASKYVLADGEGAVMY